MAAGGLMFVIAIWEIASKHHHEGAAVRWADLFAAAMLLGEGLHRAPRRSLSAVCLYVPVDSDGCASLCLENRS
jgi:hypothetical protein